MHFLLSCLLGLGITAAALLSVQNAAAVSIKLLIWQSVPLPFGMMLVLAVSVGLFLVALLRPAGQATASSNADLNLDDFDSEEWQR
ncbi:hypothetical protein C1752_06144 [Acaryochloris thomasi RCC1774]|uniref:Lipopolysaccharide assembly protein A domain-containing protein n=1 Tax=Acaryochloris thomasi RCC1774 TaxID=1764569 RepID=A0A2W1JN04_9CYAN|nr:lipopolysaccharide assembly protein LapA domain-containing protein [Acaryochloris thomasi]PZD71524.1 hypothetical protein C1752_06144 [Acaryochloris thomasi RCC1774]